MKRPERLGVGWALEQLWRASDAPISPVFTPSQHFNSTPLVGLAFPLSWGMETAEYVKRMGFIGSVEVTEIDDTHRRIALNAYSETEWWYPPQLAIDLGQDQEGQPQSCNVLVAPAVVELGREPATLRRIGAVSPQLLGIEAAGEAIDQLAQYAEVVEVRRLALATGALLLNAAAIK
ncbi:MAG TPA: hypothetical protein VLF62_02335 [Candidatus Saccharimonadales bacterium]|nr:hypothetical protein [Candidatus Saccharimonadales bacterium]